jgi:serine/threonine protein kinase
LRKIEISGLTYLAWHVPEAKKVTLREYFPVQLVARAPDGINISLHPKECRRLFESSLIDMEQQAEIVMRLKHPGIAQVTDYFRDHGTLYLVSGCFCQQTLSEYLSHSGKQPCLKTMELFQPVLDGLAAAHEMNLLHLDIHPENLCIKTDGQAVLSGFGFIRNFQEGRFQSWMPAVNPGFAAVEQYHRNGRRGPWTDVYSIAAMVYLTVTGQLPPDSVERITEDHIVPVNKWVPELSATIAAAIMQGLSVRPGERPQSIPEFRQRLTSAQVVKCSNSQDELFQETAMTRYLRLSVEAAEREANDAAKNNPDFAKIGKKTWLIVMAAIIMLVVGGWLFRGQ